MRPLRTLALGSCLIAGMILVVAAGAGQAQQAKQKPGAKPGEINTPPAKGERPAERLKTGDPAPDFTLSDSAGKIEVKLSSFQGKKPVVLIFGSHT